MIRHSLCVLMLLAGSTAAVPEVTHGADWPGFRGDGTGITEEQNLPETWSPEENVKWTAKLPEEGNSSPIVSRGRLFVTCAIDGGKQRTLYCFDRKDGKELWAQTVEFTGKERTHKTNPYCGSTPAADEERVLVWHGSQGLYCYDFEGKELWSRDLGDVGHMWGYGSSPVIYGDMVFLNFGPGEESFVVALDLSSGKQLWRTEEPGGNNDNDGGLVGSWCTPSIVSVDGDDQLLCAMPTRVVAYDPKNGEILWTCEGLAGKKGNLVYTSLVAADGIAVAMGGYNGPSMGLKLGGRGDVTSANRLWRTEERQPQRIGSGVILAGRLFVANAGPGSVQCMDPRSGEVIWEERFPSGGNHWGSTVFGDGKLYVTNQNGVTHVFRPNAEKLELIASNELPGSSNSTPALSDGEIFIRTSEGVFCISEAAKSE